MSRKNEIYLVLEEWKIIHKVGAKTVLNQIFYFGQNDSVCLDLVLFLVLVLVRMGLAKLPFMLLTEMVSWLNWSWLAKASLIAFSCIWANLFSYLETFARVGLMQLPSMLEMVALELVTKGKLGNLLLHLGELVIVL